MAKKKPQEPRLILITGEITYDTMFSVQAQLLEAELKSSEPVTVRICSPGGDVGAGFGIYDLLRASPCQVRMEAYGECSSIAVVILMAGDSRFASPNTRLMVHNAKVHVEGDMGAKDFKQGHRDIDLVNSQYDKVISSRCEIDLEKVQKWTRQETYFSSVEAKNVGLIQGVL